MNLSRICLSGAAGLALTAAADAASATTVIGDHVLTRAYYNDDRTRYGEFEDTIGSRDDWNTEAIEVTRSLDGANFEFKIFTNKDTNWEGGVGYADFFIDLQPDNPISGPFNGWDLAVDLYDTGRGLWELDGPEDWETSQDIYRYRDSTYGGLFRPAICGDGNAVDSGAPDACEDIPEGAGDRFVQGFAAATNITADPDDYLGAIDIDIDQAISDRYNTSTVISFSIAASVLNQGGFDVFWGTANCANDSIWGHVPGSPPPGKTPEPLSLSLFGLGLLGALYGVRRRRSAAA